MTRDDPRSDERIDYRTCPLCEATCGLAMTLSGDRVVRVRGDADDVFSRGYICPKGAALGELHEDPDRLRAPLVRDGDGFREVSWDEAFERVAVGLAPFVGAGERHAIAAYVGNPSVHNLGTNLFLRPFLKALATRKLFTASTVDQIPRHVASGLLFGDPYAMPVPDIDRSDYLLLLGANPWESNGSLWTAPNLPGRLKALRRRGGRLTVVDPRRTRTAANADEHLAIRPGGDAAWLLALAQVILAEGLARPGRLADMTRGLDGLATRVAAFTPEAVAARTGIDAAVTRRVARELARAAHGAVYGRIGTHANPFGTLAAWATDVLNLLTGNLDREGGVMFPVAPHEKAPSPGLGRGFSTGRWRSRVSGHPEVMGELPAACLAEEIDTPGADRIRALVTVAGNPVLSVPEGRRLDRALESLDFMVSVDIYLNETTRHADVILPPCSPLERSHYDLVFTRFAVRATANFSAPALARSGPDDAEILMRLTRIVAGTPDADPAGVGEDQLRRLIEREVGDPASPIAGCDVAEIAAAVSGDDASERILDFKLRVGAWGDGFADDVDGLSLARLRAAPHGIDLGALEPRLPAMIRTASGTIELDAPSIDGELERAAATLGEPGEDLLLIGRREFHSNNSWMHNIPSLIERPERCTLRMNAADAGRLGLDDGQRVRISSRAGAVVAPLEVHAEMPPGVVSLPHGYGHGYAGVRLGRAAAHAGVSANDVVVDAVDPLSGNAVLNGVSVTVAAA
ncbi:MAG: molybdopterin-dependent oxidoreductase [Gammaproteobacteria bacterium]